ncbi:MAG: T9SS type A sorting domain-containing protein [Bacteroidota bacterium]|nr:T9SS type A sorting domain-containing protein [Bacteroidota bacterium]
MKLKLLLFFLVVLSCSVVLKAQTKKPYNQLLITEVRLSGTPDNYVEVTNMGNETINLADFEIARFSPWPNNADNWKPLETDHFRLWDPTMYPKNSPLHLKKTLAPGKSYLIAIARDFGPEMWFKNPLKYPRRSTKKEFFEIADLLLHSWEENSVPGLDSITPHYQLLDAWHGYNGMFIRHHFLNETGAKDSMIIDVFNGQFDDADGTNSSNCDCGFAVAGVADATRLTTLVRKFSVKQGIRDFSSHDANLAAAKVQFNQAKGLDLADSEWIPIPNQGWDEPWKAVYWTAGNQVDQVLNANLLESKTGKVTVDLAKSVITVPWGVRGGDSLMFQFKKKPGLGWKYSLSGSVEDSATISASKGDTLILYVTGSNPVIKKFAIDVLAPTKDDNIVIPKNAYDWRLMRYPPIYLGSLPANYLRMEVTDGVKGGDTIRGLSYAVRVDTLLRYLEKAPLATWKIVYKSGIERPDLQTGDILRVTSESAKVKDYYIKCMSYVPSDNPFLSAITWPDMPIWFKGDVAKSYGWKGDTIPGFNPSNLSYVLKIPSEFDGIPALTYTKEQLDLKVTVKRATTLSGTPENRTVYFYTVAENDSTKRVYSVRFEKEKNPEFVQPWKGDAFISQWVYKDDWANDYLEVVNPSTEPIDMSNYLFIFAWGPVGDTWNWDNGPNEYGNAYLKYVPGKKWQDQANWQVQPRILIPDLNVNSIVYPGDVFVMASIRQNRWASNLDMSIYFKEIDINFGNQNVKNCPNNPWGYTGWNNLLTNWQGNWGGNIFMYKILNDSVKNGLKPATNIKDFELMELLGNNNNGKDFKVDGVENHNALFSYYRKPNIYKANPVPLAAYGTSAATSEWNMVNEAKLTKQGIRYPFNRAKIIDGIGSHIMDDVTIYRSTVSSKVYKVSPGYGKKETIKGLTTGTTVSGFYTNILKPNEKQTLKVKSAANGKVLAASDAIAKGDSLIVLSADSINTSKYILDVTANGLSSNALLTSAKFTVNVTGTTGTISGIKQRELLKNVFANVVVPAGATMTMVDVNDAYMTLSKLNYDSTYVNVIATDKVFFEVIAENGTTKILYQLKPTVNTSDAFVTSDVYSIDQFASLIQFVPGGTSVKSLLSNVTPSAGATIVVYDKAGFERTLGDIYKDDKLIVTSADGKVTKAYYFSMLNFHVNKYLAYVISDDYPIDQVKRLITAPVAGTDMGTFINKLYPSFGATLQVLDKTGKPSKLTTLASGDQLLVTAADGVTTALYSIKFFTGLIDTGMESIKMYPNPTTGRVVINGLTAGNRVQVFNAVGLTLRDVIVDNATEYVSLAAQPAGIYVFVISSGEKFINIQKIVKQ